MTDFETLIPELKDWNNGRGIDVESWIGCVGDFQKAIGYSTIFWPRFFEIDDCVVREGCTREYIQGWLAHCGGDRRAVETVVNHLHLLDLHHFGCTDATAERLAYLGRTLKEVYECKLEREFPTRTFTVEFDEPSSEALLDYVLTFYQTERTE